MHRLRLAAFVALSLAVHGAVGAAFVVRPKAPEVGPVAPVVLAGETFDLGDLEAPPPQTVVAAPVQAEAETETATVPVGETRTRTRTSTSTSTSSSTSATSSGVGEPVLYGAVGDRSAVDVAVAFTRSFPQASSTDRFWETVAFGDCGSTNVTFVLADDGTLESWSASGNPSEALKRAVDRTLALIKGRTFVASGKTTTIRVSAKVSPDEVHDGLHGDVFAVGGSYSGGEGSAFFALAIGRRVDVTVHAAR